MVKKCKKCNLKAHKLDENGFCYDCSDNLVFKAKSSILSYKEVKQLESPEEYFESESFKAGATDPIFTGFGVTILYLFYCFVLAKDKYSELDFFGAWLKPFFISLIIGLCVMLAHITIGEISKKLWLSMGKRFYTMRCFRIFSAIVYFVIPLLLCLLIAIKTTF